MQNERVYENSKMAIDVDIIDTVFITNKFNNSVTSVQVNDEDGFQLIYTEDDTDLINVSFSPGGNFELLSEDVQVTNDTDLEDV